MPWKFPLGIHYHYAYLQAEDECNNSKWKEAAESIDDRCSQVIFGLFNITDTGHCGRLGKYCICSFGFGFGFGKYCICSLQNHGKFVSYYNESLSLTCLSILDSMGEGVGNNNIIIIIW